MDGMCRERTTVCFLVTNRETYMVLRIFLDDIMRFLNLMICTTISYIIALLSDWASLYRLCTVRFTPANISWINLRFAHQLSPLESSSCNGVHDIKQTGFHLKNSYVECDTYTAKHDTLSEITDQLQF